MHGVSGQTIFLIIFSRTEVEEEACDNGGKKGLYENGDP